MDQNLPEGDLFMRIRELFPKQPMTPMHLLALIGRNGIGRLGYSLPDQAATPLPRTLSKPELLRTAYTPEVFAELGGRLLEHRGRHCRHATQNHGAGPADRTDSLAHREGRKRRLPRLGSK
jgi:hypothetical protein